MRLISTERERGTDRLRVKFVRRKKDGQKYRESIAENYRMDGDKEEDICRQREKVRKIYKITYK